jgi:hypothetical protein
VRKVGIVEPDLDELFATYILKDRAPAGAAVAATHVREDRRAG